MATEATAGSAPTWLLSETTVSSDRSGASSSRPSSLAQPSATTPLTAPALHVGDQVSEWPELGVSGRASPHPLDSGCCRRSEGCRRPSHAAERGEVEARPCRVPPRA